jgi:uncharacterized protein (TIGR03382 family)
MSKRAIVWAAVMASVTGLLGTAQGQVRITEFMSEGQGDIDSGNGGRRQREFFELTNLGSAPVDISGWTYNDNNTNDPLAFGASFGTIQAGESIVLTQMTADAFRTYWGLGSSVRVFSIGGSSNLGNADTINIYNSTLQDSSTLVDSVTYTSDARGSGVSRNRPLGGTGQSPNSAWVTSFVGDVYGSFLAPNAVGFPPSYPNPDNYRDLANPGSYIPAPGAACALALMGVAGLRRRR